MENYELRYSVSSTNRPLTHSSISGVRPPGVVIKATPITVPEMTIKMANTSSEGFVSSASRRAAASGRAFRAYQTKDVDQLYRELLHKSPTKTEPTAMSGTRSQSRPGTSKSSRATPTISESPRYSRRSSPVTKGKISVFNIRRPDHTAAKTERIRFDYQNAHRPHSNRVNNAHYRMVSITASECDI